MSVLAFVVACLSAIYTKKQAKAAYDMAMIEKARRHDELTPRFTPELEQLPNAGAYQRLHLTLESPRALTMLHVRLIEAPVDVQFSRGVEGTEVGALSPIRTAFAVPHAGIALRPYERATWQIELNSVPERGLRLQVDAAIGDEKWQIQVSVPMPPTPSVW